MKVKARADSTAAEPSDSVRLLKKTLQFPTRSKLLFSLSRMWILQNMSGDLEGEQSESHNDCLYCKIENKVPSDGGMVE